MAKNTENKVYPLGEQFAPLATASEKRRSFYARHRYGVRIGSIIGLALILIAIGIFILTRHTDTNTSTPQKTSSTSSATTNNDAPISAEAQQTIQQASAAASAGDTTAATDSLNKAAQSTTDTDEKVAYYSQASTISVNSGKYDDAITDAQNAINADPNNYVLYANLGYIYEAASKNDLAISSFQKAIEVFKANPDSEATITNGGTAGLQAEIDRLKK